MIEAPMLNQCYICGRPAQMKYCRACMVTAEGYKARAADLVARGPEAIEDYLRAESEKEDHNWPVVFYLLSVTAATTFGVLVGLLLAASLQGVR